MLNKKKFLHEEIENVYSQILRKCILSNSLPVPIFLLVFVNIVILNICRRAIQRSFVFYWMALTSNSRTPDNEWDAYINSRQVGRKSTAPGIQRSPVGYNGWTWSRKFEHLTLQVSNGFDFIRMILFLMPAGISKICLKLEKNCMARPQRRNARKIYLKDMREKVWQIKQWVQEP